jgi:hypothetical protein
VAIWQFDLVAAATFVSAPRAFLASLARPSD